MPKKSATALLLERMPKRMWTTDVNAKRKVSCPECNEVQSVEFRDSDTLVDKGKTYYLGFCAKCGAAV